MAAGASLPVSFTPHLLPVDRGILSTMYFRPRSGLAGTDAWLQKYRTFYKNEPFVEVSEAGSQPGRGRPHELLPHRGAGG